VRRRHDRLGQIQSTRRQRWITPCQPRRSLRRTACLNRRNPFPLGCIPLLDIQPVNCRSSGADRATVAWAYSPACKSAIPTRPFHATTAAPCPAHTGCHPAPHPLADSSAASGWRCPPAPSPYCLQPLVRQTREKRR
jgi:hypothetical protein